MALLSQNSRSYLLKRATLYDLIGRLCWWRIVLPFLLVITLTNRSMAEAAQVSEYEVKAAFLLNFTKFVEWKPEAFTDTNSPLAVCMLGLDPFGSAIDLTIENEVVNNRKLVVRRISDVPPTKTCQILFITSTGRELRRILRQVGPGVLTVGDADDFIASGGMIQFTLENRRVRFEIARGVAENMGIQMSSQLLKVARAVR